MVPLTKVIPRELFLHIVLSSSADITRVDVFVEELFMFRFVSFRFKAKENLQHCGDVFFDILITSKGVSALGMFETLIGV